MIWDNEVNPSVWKAARIVLAPKDGKDLSNPSGYRPISLFPIWGKFLDKIVRD